MTTTAFDTAVGLADDASDLWDRPPTRPRTCAGCGRVAEIYDRAFGCCWLCVATGQVDRIMHTVTRAAGKSPARKCLPAGAGGGR